MHGFAAAPSVVVDPDLPWDMTNPTTAEPRLARMSEVVAGDVPGLGSAIQAATQLARAQSLQGKLDEADRTLDRAQRDLGSLDDPEAKIRLLLEKGRLLVLAKTPMVAQIRFLEAFELANKRGLEFYAIDAAQMMSVVETKKKKKAWTKRALAIAEESKDLRVASWLGPLHADMGFYFEEQVQYAEALERFQKAAACFEKAGAIRQATSARCCEGRILRRMNRVEEALAAQLKIESDMDSEGSEGLVFEEIGECLQALKRPEEATKYFSRAYSVLSLDTWVTNNEASRLKRLKTLGNVKRQT